MKYFQVFQGSAIKNYVPNPERQKQPPVMFYEKKNVLRNFAKFTEKHLCHSLFFNKVAGLRTATLSKKETLAQVFYCEFCKISKNTFPYKIPPVAASGAAVSYGMCSPFFQQ